MRFGYILISEPDMFLLVPTPMPTLGRVGHLFLPQPHHHLRERRIFHLLSIENCPNRFAIKPGLFGCLAQSTRTDLCYQTFVSGNPSAVMMNAHVIDVFDEIVFACSNRETSFPMQCGRPPLIVIRRSNPRVWASHLSPSGPSDLTSACCT